jgi:hypothetical protein
MHEYTRLYFNLHTANFILTASSPTMMNASIIYFLWSVTTNTCLLRPSNLQGMDNSIANSLFYRTVAYTDTLLAPLAREDRFRGPIVE